VATTIAYDQPVKDLIDELDATGHVTHTQHRKTHVTLHHNGARLSHEGVLAVWQVRPASAHFDVDAPGAVAQYVRVNEYAWATGSTEGNQRSISIEMCNETLGPEWKVGDATWRSAARLAGWLFARVIGTRPTRETLVVHKYWSATTCAGPYVDGVYNDILWFAQQAYDSYAAGQIPDGGDEVSKQEVIDGLREFYRNFGGEARSATVSHPEPVKPEQVDAEGNPVTTSIELEARWNAHNVAQTLERLDRIEERIERLQTGTGYTLAELAKAINDDRDKRERDGDAKTGPVS